MKVGERQRQWLFYVSNVKEKEGKKKLLGNGVVVVERIVEVIGVFDEGVKFTSK